MRSEVILSHSDPCGGGGRQKEIGESCSDTKIQKINPKTFLLPEARGSQFQSQFHAILTCQNGGAMPIMLPVIITEG